MPKGNIILIPFPFTDLSGNKLRPALVLSENNLDVTVSFITTQLQWKEPEDILLNPSAHNGIKKPSIVRLSKIATIDRNLAIGVIGSISSTQIVELDQKLKLIFQLT
ncbi:MAG: type II toxin-antitoxin system PemK/MazF family toxin [Sphingobacteriales bacterium]